MNQRKTVIVIKLGDREIDFILFFQLFISVDGVEKSLGECADDAFLVVADDIAEELIYKFDFEVCQVETSIVV